MFSLILGREAVIEISRIWRAYALILAIMLSRSDCEKLLDSDAVTSVVVYKVNATKNVPFAIGCCSYLKSLIFRHLGNFINREDFTVFVLARGIVEN